MKRKPARCRTYHRGSSGLAAAQRSGSSQAKMVKIAGVLYSTSTWFLGVELVPTPLRPLLPRAGAGIIDAVVLSRGTLLALTRRGFAVTLSADPPELLTDQTAGLSEAPVDTNCPVRRGVGGCIRVSLPVTPATRNVLWTVESLKRAFDPDVVLE